MRARGRRAGDHHAVGGIPVARALPPEAERAPAGHSGLLAAAVAEGISGRRHLPDARLGGNQPSAARGRALNPAGAGGTITAMPYLSVVVSPGGAETEVFRERWRAQAERHGLSSEVIPAGGAGSRSRNADIRSASGEYLLATTADTVFPDELIEFLASQRLQANRMYRADRYDTSRVWAREGVFPLTPEGLRANAAEDMAPAGSGIHFGSGWFPASRLAGQMGRFLASDAEVVLARMPQPWAAMDMEVEPGPGVRPPAVLQVIDRDGAVAAEWNVERRMAVRFWVPP